MRNNRHILIGLTIILVGLVALADSLFDLDLGRFLCPTVLIVAGIALLIRPRTIGAGTKLTAKLLGDIKRRGAWPVVDEEIWLGAGDIKLDMSNADIPAGETRIRALGLVNEIVLTVPQGLGIAVSSTACLTTAKVYGLKSDSFFTPFEFTSEGYETAERKVHVETTYVVADIKIRQSA